MDLNGFRNKLDDTDNEMIRLFIRRMKIIEEIAAYKSRNDISVRDAERERTVIERLCSLTDEKYHDYIKTLYGAVFECGRTYQANLIRGAEKRFGLVGEDLSHSYSKIIHGMFGEYDYELLSLPRGEIEDFILRGKYDGLNVTIPYKKTVYPLCGELSETASNTGSVNTVIKQSDGIIKGFNTDYKGFKEMIERSGIDVRNKYAVVLGGGGTSSTVQAYLKDRKAKIVRVVSRSGEYNYANLNIHKECEILINATPVGMYPNNETAPVSLSDFPNCSAVIDVIYNPLRTDLLIQANKKKIPNAGGLYMLLAQAKESYAIFTGNKISEERLNDIYDMLVKSVENIVLIGMPGCGKTAVGKLVSERLDRPFVDIDGVTAEKFNMTIPEIFGKYGEEKFREYESETIKEYGKQKGLVISTGGGAVLREENRRALMWNGKIYYIDRSVEKLAVENRPLSIDTDNLKKMYEYRKKFYEEAAGKIIDNNTEPESAADEIVKDFK